jgi:NAD(P)-dependent dehydrogenase (short-subunit alcohol dehydrogenase family)
MKQVIVVTGASSGFGALAARALAEAGHTVYASMRETAGRNAVQVKAVEEFATTHKANLRAIELDVASQDSADSAVWTIVEENGRLDVVVHNAGHMVFGPAEAFTPEQFAELYDVNVLSTQRVNRAALPQLRKQGRGLLVWVSSSSVAGGTPPYLSPYFAAGCIGRTIRARTGAVGHRNLYYCAGSVYQGHQPLRPCRRACRQTASGGVRSRTL